MGPVWGCRRASARRAPDRPFSLFLKSNNCPKDHDQNNPRCHLGIIYICRFVYVRPRQIPHPDWLALRRHFSTDKGSWQGYVKTVSMCFIGNGYGVSITAYAFYQSMIDRFTDYEIWSFLHLVNDSDFASRLTLKDCAVRYRSLLTYFRSRTSQPELLAIIDYIARATDDQLPNIGRATALRQLLNLK